MTDWDGDGKHTWKDDYIYLEELKSQKKVPVNCQRTNASGNGKIMVVCLILFLCWELLNIIAASIY